MSLINKTALSKMTDDMKVSYEAMFSDVTKLANEWRLCDTQYNKAIEASSQNTTAECRREMRRVSDYWIRRRQSLERVLSEEDLLKIKQKQ